LIVVLALACQGEVAHFVHRTLFRAELGDQGVDLAARVSEIEPRVTVNFAPSR